MEELQKQLNEFQSVSQAARGIGLNHQRLLYGVRRNRIPHLTLPGGHLAIRLEDAQTYAESLSK